MCLASLVGKYVRDLLTARAVRHHKRTLPHLPMVSGYHDPVTTRFIEDTAALRAETRFPADCFERRAVGDDADDSPPLDDPAPASLVEPASRL